MKRFEPHLGKTLCGLVLESRGTALNEPGRAVFAVPALNYIRTFNEKTFKITAGQVIILKTTEYSLGQI